MNNSEETLKNEPVLAAIAELSKKIDALENSVNEKFAAFENSVNGKFKTFENSVNEKFDEISRQFEIINAQFESIRQGIVHNSAAFDRLEAKFLLLRADVKELTEEIRQQGKTFSGETLVLEK